MYDLGGGSGGRFFYKVSKPFSHLLDGIIDPCLLKGLFGSDIGDAKLFPSFLLLFFKVLFSLLANNLFFLSLQFFSCFLIFLCFGHGALLVFITC